MAENQYDLSPRILCLLTILNSLLLCLGNTGGPILLRTYFLHGGRRQRISISSFLETAGFPLLLIPLSLSYLHRRRSNPSTPFTHLNTRLLIASTIIGILTGLDDFLYAYGLDYLPVSTAIVLTATHLGFTAFFAFLIVRQRFTPFSINAIALLTVGAAVLALHANGDRPKGVSAAGYWKGFFMTIGAAMLYGLVLPLMELAYAKAEIVVTYTLVMEMQFVMGLFATAFCVVGMVINEDFQGIDGEAEKYGLGEGKYYLVLVWCAVFWQCFFVGAVGVIFCVNTLLAAVIIASLIPVVEVLGVVFLQEKFSGEKAVSLILSLWGLLSYSYGEYRRRNEESGGSRSPAAAAPTVEVVT
ncbi:purine permease 3-like, partial [Phalaenopsis equestris]|uniref:purine permease 3-like n=1 Tax=Phalaenopsis equestris TaxID=78828 RepID=UPI0009E5A2C9